MGDELDALKVHSFVIKLWLDESLDEPGHRQLHGYITHVPSETRRYIESPDDILSFIQSYVGQFHWELTHPVQSDLQRVPSWRKAIQRLSRSLWHRWPKKKS